MVGFEKLLKWHKVKFLYAFYTFERPTLHLHFIAIVLLFSYPPSVTSVISKQWEWYLEGIMCFRKWYPLKQVLWADGSCHPLESVILYLSPRIWFTNSVIFICFLFFPRFVYISTMGWWLVPSSWIRHFASLTSDLI